MEVALDAPGGSTAKITTVTPGADRRRRRRRIEVEGIVQGVGFRPYVYGLAVQLGLGGLVRNDARGVTIEVEGDTRSVEHFVELLGARLPPLAAVHRLSTAPVPAIGDTAFVIASSDPAGRERGAVTADAATCPACRREVTDRSDRRHGYPFTNCTDCGPRYTITTAVPYDRVRTTMAGFEMCPACAAEYGDPADRRFDSQPIACPDCGPALSHALREIAGEIRAGLIVAIKGLGGYQLACDATNPTAVRRLRARKRREAKPFAVMVADLAGARRLCELSRAEEELLASWRAPIVLAARRLDVVAVAVADEVAPASRWLGVMLPTTALHHLLLAEVARPLVMTSGNLAETPIVLDDDEARTVLGPVADTVVTHDRPVAARADDSVARMTVSGPLLLRRARGYAPEAVELPAPVARPTLGAGGQLKHTFCLAAGRRALLSPHIGDLSTVETMRAFTATLAHYENLFAIRPEVVAHDLHPGYLSTTWALDRQDLEAIGVQHHHAHVAACLADNGRAGPVIGLALDGTGYGTDATLWGGEILVCDLRGFRRAGHLRAVPMPGGEAAVHEPWRMAAAYCHAAGAGDPPAGLALAERHAGDWSVITAMARTGTAAPLTSGAGRLFDAVSAVLCGRDRVAFEGQAAMELEQLADPRVTALLPCPLRAEADGLVVDTVDLFHAVVERHVHGEDPRVLAARFHNGLAAALVEAAGAVRDRTGLATVALSGGCFQNALLTDRCVTGFAAAGFDVLTHHQVPPNDGGLSLGQAAIAGARDTEVS